MKDTIKFLDHLDALDKSATDGPWTTGTNNETGLKYFGTGYCDCCTPPIPSAGIILGETGRAEAEFIALARTALPRLGKALRAVLVLVDEMTQDDTHSNPYVAGVQDMAGTVKHIITHELDGEL